VQPGKKPLGKVPLAQAWLEVSRSLDEKQKKVHCILIATPAGKSYVSSSHVRPVYPVSARSL
jgi:hypothetical protein